MSQRTRLDLSEYAQARILTGPPTPDDRRLAAHLGGDGDKSRVTVRWLDDGQMEVTSSSWIGVVRFSGCDVHIVPKYLGRSLSVLKMIAFTHKNNLQRPIDNRRELQASGILLPELLCHLLVEETTTLLRDGLLRSYRSEEQDLAVLRGRLDHRRQYLKRWGQIDRVHCVYDEFDRDNPENQLVCAALEIGRFLPLEPELRRSISRLYDSFSTVCRPTSYDTPFYRARITYGRLNERYRLAHWISGLLLEGAAFDDIYDTRGGVRVNAFLVDMNKLFEEFVTSLMSEVLQGTAFTIAAKRRLRTTIVDASTGAAYMELIPDLVITHTNGRYASLRDVPVDVKYKLYSDRKVGSGDLYQAFTYALALDSVVGDARAGIIFPSDRTEVATQLDIGPRDDPRRTRITMVGLAVEQILAAADIGGSAWDETCVRLLELVGQITGTSIAPILLPIG